VELLDPAVLLAAMSPVTTAIVFLSVLGLIIANPPNFDDVDAASDQPVGEVVNINQADPQSNAIHIAHNVPKDSDIKVVQTNPFNTTVHISLNVGTGSKVTVMMSNARNIQLHVSFNGMGNSECEVELDKIFNSSVHLSFQNPMNTPVKLSMKNAELTNIHVSQNVPERSPMEVSMDGAKTCQIQLSQSVPRSSPLTWNLVGDPEENQIEVRQNAGDESSPLDCTPECPQEEYVYDYAYADSAEDHGDQENEIQQPEVRLSPKDKIQEENSEYTDTQEYQYPEYPDTPTVEEYQYPEYPDTQTVEDTVPQTQAGGGQENETFQCPGGDLQTCVDVCPGQYGAQVYGACVLTCGRRCP
jgi:hypothetical protein